MTLAISGMQEKAKAGINSGSLHPYLRVNNEKERSQKLDIRQNIGLGI